MTKSPKRAYLLVLLTEREMQAVSMRLEQRVHHDDALKVARAYQRALKKIRGQAQKVVRSM